MRNHVIGAYALYDSPEDGGENGAHTLAGGCCEYTEKKYMDGDARKQVTLFTRGQVDRMSLVGSGLRDGAFRIENGVVKRTPKTLLALYQCKGLSIARAGAPSPLATLSGKHNSS
jgi:hypothetical protein